MKIHRHVGSGAAVATALGVAGMLLASGHDRVAARQAPQGAMMMAMPPSTCEGPSLKCGNAATSTFGPDGSLWTIWTADGHAWVARSEDNGLHYDEAVPVNREKVTIDTGPDERPQIVVDRDGRIVVAYAIFKTGVCCVGQVFTAVAAKDGRRFTEPRPVTDDNSSQRFINLALDADGEIFASWIDKRNVFAAEAAGKEFPGASLAFAWSVDHGATFAPARIAHDNMCECCRTGVVLAGPHRPAVLFRNIFDGERDHALLEFNPDMTPGRLTRVAEDHWKLDACPHHGPSLAVGPTGTYYAVWFSGGGVRQGSFYARSTDGGRTFSQPMRIGSAERQVTRPYVLARDKSVWMTWKEFDGKETMLFVQESLDRGAHWATPRRLKSTADFSDHPLLVSDGRRTYVSWLTRNEGYRLLPLGSSS
jgi:hypothetical protein